jgi:hypothetical protein
MLCILSPSCLPGRDPGNRHDGLGPKFKTINNKGEEGAGTGDELPARCYLCVTYWDFRDFLYFQ